MSAQLQNPDGKKTTSVIDVLEKAAAARKVQKQSRYDYWTETHNPLVCLIFVAPLLIWYECGMALNREAVRSGVDRIVEAIVMPSGILAAGLVSVVTAGIFLFLHHRHHDSGQSHVQTAFRMAIESVALATILFLASDALMLWFDNQRPSPLSGLATMFSDTQQYGKVLTALGAGIHEEVAFRLLLFAPLLTALKKRMQSETLAFVFVASFVSLMFALAHCDTFNPEALPYQTSTFLFRFFASVLLCALFRFRGIAIAIGVHAFFNILAIS